MQVVFASHNAHKLEELRRMCAVLLPGIELVGYDGPEPVEVGVSFEENALLKARAAAAHTGLPALADDSGLAVDVLGGCPGIFSARWGGPTRSDSANMQLLLWQLSDLTEQHRKASFVCAAAFALPKNAAADSNAAETFETVDAVAVRGEWRGALLREPIGEAGFGYDPIFRPHGETRSVAQLSDTEKDAHSHRRRAFTALAPEIMARLMPAQASTRPDRGK